MTARSVPETARSVPKKFLVAFSFAGEQRELVRQIAEAAEGLLGRGTVFFDEWFEHYLAGADADLRLQEIYHDRAVLVVACISERYGDKPWAQAEWSAIRALQQQMRASDDENDRLRILPIRVGDGDVEGVLINAICPDVRQRTPVEAAQLIVRRLGLIQPAAGRQTMDVERAEQLQNPIATPQHDTGTMAEDNPWYVERGADERISRALSNQSRTVAISGLPQSGKSSMAVRVGKRLRAEGYVEVMLDLKTALCDNDFSSVKAFLPALAGAVARKLGRGEKEAQSVASAEMLADFLHSLAAAAGGKFLLTLLAFDHILSKPKERTKPTKRASLEIQSHLRNFHNTTAAAPLRDLRLMLVHTMRAPTGDSPLGSIFDVAEPFEAKDFSQLELHQLVSLYGNCLSDAETDELHRVLAGHPALSRRALNYIVEERQNCGEFCKEVTSSGGIFLEEMRSLLSRFEKPDSSEHRPALARAMHRMQPCGSETDYEILRSLGLIRGTFSGDAVPRCLMFEKWFSSRLPKPRS